MRGKNQKAHCRPALCFLFFMEKIIEDNKYQKVIENPDGSVRVIRKKGKSKKGWYVRIPHRLPREAFKALNPTERLTLLILMSYEGEEALICPSLRTLADEIGLSLKWTWETIKKLEKEKYIKISKEKGKYNTYKMLF